MSGVMGSTSVSLTLSVDNELDINKLAEELAEIYRGKGFTVNVIKFKSDSCSIVFDKGVGGINNLLGLGLGIKANLTLRNGMLMVSYSDADWTGKIVGILVGWFLCLVPFITAIIGAFKQMGLPKEINNNITMLSH